MDMVIFISSIYGASKHANKPKNYLIENKRQKQRAAIKEINTKRRKVIK